MSIMPAPRINTNDDQVGVVAWHVEDGDYVDVGADLVDLETSKAVVTVAAELAGFVRRIAKKGDIVRVGSPICDISDTFSDAPISAPVAAPAKAPGRKAKNAVSDAVAAPAPVEAARTFGATRFSRDALALIDELGLDRASFEGAGLVSAQTIRERRDPSLRGGRDPVRHAVPATRAAHSTVPVPLSPREETTSLAKRAEIETLSLGESGLINSTLSVYFDSAGIRARLAQSGMFDGAVQPIILYEVSRLLRQWPQFTAFFDDNLVHFYERVDLGVAVDLGRGLKVVTIKDADRLMPTELHEAMIDFGMRYLDNRIQPHELVGSTITITDLSGLDVLHFKPLINGRQSVILGLGGDSLQPGHPMSLNMTFDHRVANGREAGTFLKELRDRLLSYAAPATHPTPAPAVGAASFAQPASAASVSCNRCGIDYDTYAREYSDPYMFACFGPSGQLEAYCHRCASGLI